MERTAVTFPQLNRQFGKYMKYKIQIYENDNSQYLFLRTTIFERCIIDTQHELKQQLKYKILVSASPQRGPSTARPHMLSEIYL